MKLLFTVILLALLGTTTFAQTQKLPVQGKLFEDNKPLTATRNFKFSITALNWEQSLANVPVSEGLYTVELDVPANLFATQKSHDLRIEVNGTLLSTAKIHAPIENDPSVPANLKDGVSWNEVTDKPATLDLDPSNEIQTLTIQGAQLSISGGNTVDLPAGGGGNGVFDTLVVGPPKLGIITTPSITSGSQAEFKSSVTQTFIAESSGRLASIELFCANSQDAGISFVVRRIGNGQQIASNSFPSAAFSATLGFQTFTPSQPDPQLKQYEQYVIEITVTGASYLFGYDPNDPYKFGQSNIVAGNGADLKFKVNIEKTLGPSMQIDTNGYVGIGTSNPTSTLTVNGRIEDQTGFVMPVGSIMAWAGSPSNPPKGWLICDGSEVSRSVYADLFQAIGTNWGAGTGSDAAVKFRIPDLRGQFLRGWSGPMSNDPDKDSRIPGFPGGVSGNNVGSYQLDASQSWKATFYSRSIRNDCATPNVYISSGGCNDAPGSGGTATPIYKVTIDLANDVRQSSETRPRNAAVLYIIKY